jgi:hypothetical protein
MSVVTLDVEPAGPFGSACFTLLQLPRALNRMSAAAPRARDMHSRNRCGRAIDMTDVLLDGRTCAARCCLTGLTTSHRYAQALSRSVLLIHKLNSAAPVVIEGNGTGPNIVIRFPAPQSGRYLLISQTGVNANNWWSVHDLNIACL